MRPDDASGTDDDVGKIVWDRLAPNPVALVLLDGARGGTTILHLDWNGALHGCREVASGPSHNGIIDAWIQGAIASNLRIDDRRA